jgi:hypothetical protein
MPATIIPSLRIATRRRRLNGFAAFSGSRKISSCLTKVAASLTRN